MYYISHNQLKSCTLRCWITLGWGVGSYVCFSFPCTHVPDHILRGLQWYSSQGQATRGYSARPGEGPTFIPSQTTKIVPCHPQHWVPAFQLPLLARAECDSVLTNKAGGVFWSHGKPSASGMKEADAASHLPADQSHLPTPRTEMKHDSEVGTMHPRSGRHDEGGRRNVGRV